MAKQRQTKIRLPRGETARGEQVGSAIAAATLPRGLMPMLTRWGKEPDTSRRAMLARYWGWVYACASISATTFASVPLRLYATTGKGEAPADANGYGARHITKAERWRLESLRPRDVRLKGAEQVDELTEHPLLDLLERMNPYANAFEAMEYTDTMLELTGDAYWYVQDGSLGVPDAIYPLMSQFMTIVPDAKDYIKGYLYGEVGTPEDRVAFEPSEIVHFKFPNPHDAWYGLGPVESAAYVIEQDRNRQRFITATYANMGRPDLVAKYTEGELSAADRKRLELEWNMAYRGPEKAGRVKVTDYRVEIEKLGWTPRELDFSAGEEWILKRICAAFPVPVGLLDSAQISRAPRSGLEGSDLFMAKLNTLPRCKRFAQKLNEDFVKRFDQRLFVEFDNPVQQDRALQLEEDTARLQTQVITINEIREREGLDPVEWGDVPLVEAGLGPLGTMQAEPQQGGAGGFPAATQQATPAADGSKPAGGPDSEVQVVATPGKRYVDGASVHRDLYGLVLRSVGDGMTLDSGPDVGRTVAGRFASTRTGGMRADRRMGVEDRRRLRVALKPIEVGQKAEDAGGRWVTMNGAPVFIREGQSPEEAAQERFGGEGGGTERLSAATRGLGGARDTLVSRLGGKLSPKQRDKVRYEISNARDELRNIDTPEAKERLAHLDRAEEAIRAGNNSGAANALERAMGTKR